MNSNLPTVLHQAGLLCADQEAKLTERVSHSNRPVAEIIAELGYFQPPKLLSLLSKLFALPVINVADYEFYPVCQSLGLRELIMQHCAIPIQSTQHQLLVAVSDPCDLAIEEDFRFATAKQIELVLADIKQIKGEIRRLYGAPIDSEVCMTSKELDESELTNLVELADEEQESDQDLSADSTPVSRYINQILLDAIRKGASDIHFEPYENRYRIRLRCDGLLYEIQSPSHTLSRRISARLKIIAKLDISERRLPQDGRFKLLLNPKTSVDMRISTLPTQWGEKVVLRLLDSGHVALNIDSLGMNQIQRSQYLTALSKPQGLILITGPTGSGKTVSLYSGLKHLNTDQVNIATAEDPVEIHLPGINQVSVNAKIGLNFAMALRAFLRQDPDILMVGEIRDLDTAKIAVKAAQTGHLVLSTLHTNSAAESINRLQSIGIPGFELSSSLSLVIAQRLARKLCPHCKQQDILPAEICQQLALDVGQVVYRESKQGCNECNQGFLGRTGLYEVMTISRELVETINQGADADTIEAIANEQGMQTLKQSAAEKLRAGITSYPELQRVLYL